MSPAWSDFKEQNNCNKNGQTLHQIKYFCQNSLEDFNIRSTFSWIHQCYKKFILFPFEEINADFEMF